MKEAQQ